MNWPRSNLRGSALHAEIDYRRALASIRAREADLALVQRLSAKTCRICKQGPLWSTRRTVCTVKGARRRG